MQESGKQAEKTGKGKESKRHKGGEKNVHMRKQKRSQRMQGQYLLSHGEK
jgi:hypothetical protein